MLFWDGPEDQAERRAYDARPLIRALVLLVLRVVPKLRTS
jgi:hypothetical protein